jgi:chorismate mutase
MTDKPSSSPNTQSPSTQSGVSELGILRDQIDDIDNALLTLLAKRQDLSRLIVTKKALGSNVFRPDREVSLLRNLVAGHPEIDARLIMGLWRHIISASIAEQKPDYTIAHSPRAVNLADNHGAGYMRLAPYEDVTASIAALQSGQADCVILTEAEMAAHSHLLVADEVVIAASIGFLMQQGQERGYILCRDLPLASGDDVIVVRGADGTLSYHADAEDISGAEIVGRYAKPLEFS